MSAKKGLGRSFDSLIPTELLDESFDPTAAQDDQVSDLRHIKLSEISADPDQPRRTFDDDALEELAASIKEHGILQPIVVTPKAGGYQIVAGERRYRAAKKAGLEKIPALVRTLTNQHKLELSLIENLQRRDLNVMETATAYLKLRDQFNLTLEQIGHRVGGKAVSSISNTLRLLRLPESVRKALVERKLTEGQARPLVNVDPEIIEEILPVILKEEWSARRIEQYIVQLKNAAKSPQQSEPKKVSQLPYEENTKRLMKRLATDVQIKTTARGRGQIVIKFKNDADFKRIQQLLEG
ncbi:ParB/RepB/Spo0J family partition protein [Streptomyces caniscabiei]|uniref:ParB/RepB/Spo0J family partition protein n=1 Tax=Streptomyces caniscabiei TaxID=2746961 RepID=UPI0029A93CE4|nr:ParB/RepB/Spo0J family partition protein [Streptomyces caniscabiei]MDX2776234.1 ParB/RepB/Spo0J family partition protein [Streptomyces caniscabiei]